MIFGKDRVAAKVLVGEFSDAWQTMLTTFEPNPDWPMEVCAKPFPLKRCPETERRKVDFPQALVSLLVANGYITDEERKKLAFTFCLGLWADNRKINL